MVFLFLTENLNVKKEKFLMYPRFLQMLINEQAPDLPKEEKDVISLDHMTDYTVRSMGTYKRNQQKPRDKKLIGHLINPAYKCPPGSNWRNEGSESETEDMEVPKGPAPEEGQSSRPATGVGSDGVPVNAKEDDDVVEVDQYEFRERKRPRLVLRRLRRDDSGEPQATQAHPTQSTPMNNPDISSTSRDTGTATTSTSSADQLATLNSVMIKMMSDYQKQQDLVEKLVAEKEEREERDRKMAEEYNNMKLLLFNQTVKVEKYENRIKELEDSYEELSNRLYEDPDGFVRMRGKDADSDDELLKIADASAASVSGTGTVKK